MASLDIIDESPKPPTRRSLRRRSGIFEHTLSKKALESNSSEQSTASSETEPQNKRRVIKQPRKRCSKVNDDQLSCIKDYYLCKKFKRLPSSFETIYEEPKLQKNKFVFVASKKEKRILSFGNSSTVTTGKVKKRRLKIKKLLPSQSFMKRERLSMDYFLQKIGNCDRQSTSTDSSP